jgi:gamma-glutamylcyclotransferase (GGCT)/AIG2-like uncharacterized protein YtfP
MTASVSDATMTAFVFAYASLVGLEPARPCVLRDHARGWDVAMDNRETIPGYKFYVDAETGRRPAVYVAFLAIRYEPGAAVSGEVFAVDDEQLAALDRRERNYDRRDVSAHISGRGDGSGPVWAYVGSAAGRARCVAGRAAGTAVIGAEYLASVSHAEPPDLPVRPLLRRDVGA